MSGMELYAHSLPPQREPRHFLGLEIFQRGSSSPNLFKVTFFSFQDIKSFLISILLQGSVLAQGWYQNPLHSLVAGVEDQQHSACLYCLLLPWLRPGIPGLPLSCAVHHPHWFESHCAATRSCCFLLHSLLLDLARRMGFVTAAPHCSPPLGDWSLQTKPWWSPCSVKVWFLLSSLYKNSTFPVHKAVITAAMYQDKNQKPKISSHPRPPR